MAALMRLVKDGAPILPSGETAEEVGIVHIRFLTIIGRDFGPHITRHGERITFNATLENAMRKFVELREIEPNEKIHVQGEYDPAAENLVLSFIGGNGHNLIGLIRTGPIEDFVLSESPELPLNLVAGILPEEELYERISNRTWAHLEVLRKLAHLTTMPIVQIGAPPVIADEKHILRTIPPALHSGLDEVAVNDRWYRYKLWRLNSRIYAEESRKIGAIYIDYVEDALEEGFLAERFQRSDDCIHANGHYTKELMKVFLASAPRQRTPYNGQPERAFWSASIARTALEDVDPATDLPFTLGKEDRIVTAGSCFAQELAHRLSTFGYNYHVTEKGPADLSSEERKRRQFGVYSARYGNIYTARQLLQLFDRAYNRFTPVEPVWHRNDYFVDAFRPQIEPDGFASAEDTISATNEHLACVRAAFEEADIFIFTLGLTEAFRDARDGSVYPVCPGVAGGSFSPNLHVFHNFSAEEVIGDLRAFFKRFRSVNPAAKIILTVSPVPLVATATDDHVLTATTYSKSVLRVAAQVAADTDSNSAYFPSYEIITGAFSRGSYFEKNLRRVSREGVDHVMRSFFTHATAEASSSAVDRSAIETNIEIVCEEELLDALGS